MFIYVYIYMCIFALNIFAYMETYGNELLPAPSTHLFSQWIRDLCSTKRTDQAAVPVQSNCSEVLLDNLYRQEHVPLQLDGF